MKPTVLDLFAGCGGLGRGLVDAGFDVRWANELDPYAAETYSAFHSAKVWVEDASKFLARIVDNETSAPTPGDVDLVVGGPPCNGFSGYNRYQSPDDPRNSLMEMFLAFVEVLRPPYVLIENVPGMLQMANGEVARSIIAILKGLGYGVRLGILQAGYYGIPQNRWRVFLVAAKKGLTLPLFPEPTTHFPRTTIFGAKAFRDYVVRPISHEPTLFGKLACKVAVRDAIKDLPLLVNGQHLPEVPYLHPPESAYEATLRYGSRIIANHACRKLGELMMERVSSVPLREGAGWLDLPESLRPRNLAKHGDRRYDNRFGRLWWDGTFNTIVSESNPYWGRVIHPEQNRVISVREAARAQSLPDTMHFFGTLTSQYRQVGNAVPPKLAAAIGKEILLAMEGRWEV